MNVDYNVVRYDGSNTQRIKDFNNGMYFHDSVPHRSHRQHNSEEQFIGGSRKIELQHIDPNF